MVENECFFWSVTACQCERMQAKCKARIVVTFFLIDNCMLLSSNAHQMQGKCVPTLSQIVSGSCGDMNLWSMFHKVRPVGATRQLCGATRRQSRLSKSCHGWETSRVCERGVIAGCSNGNSCIQHRSLCGGKYKCEVWLKCYSSYVRQCCLSCDGHLCLNT